MRSSGLCVSYALTRAESTEQLALRPQNHGPGTSECPSAGHSGRGIAQVHRVGTLARNRPPARRETHQPNSPGSETEIRNDYAWRLWRMIYLIDDAPSAVTKLRHCRAFDRGLDARGMLCLAYSRRIPATSSETPGTGPTTGSELQFYDVEIPLSEVVRKPFRGLQELGQTPNPAEYVMLRNTSESPATILIDYIEITAPLFRIMAAQYASANLRRERQSGGRNRVCRRRIRHVHDPRMAESPQ